MVDKSTLIEIYRANLSDPNDLPEFQFWVENELVKIQSSFFSTEDVLRRFELWLQELEKEPGPKGKDGEDGEDGIDGVDGEDGIDGADGKDGSVDDLIDDTRTSTDTTWSSFKIEDELHDQKHDLYGPDHSDVLVDVAPTLRDGLFWNGTQFSLDRRMNWAGNYVNGQTYEADDVTLDSGYLAVANQQTTDPPSPQLIGDEVWLLDEDDPSWEIDSPLGKDVATGISITAINGISYAVNEARIYIPAISNNVYYRIAIAIYYDLENPETAVGEWIHSTDLVLGWNDYDTNKYIIPNGILVEAFLQVENRNNVVVDNLQYNYTSNNNDQAVAVGEMHRRNNRTYVDINKTPASGTFTADPTPGTTIETAVSDWTVTNVTDNTTYWRCDITGTGNPPDGLTDFIFTTPSNNVAQPHAVNDNYWLSHVAPNANINGRYSLDGSDETNDNAYGINYKVQQVVLSDHWDILTIPGDTGGFVRIDDNIDGGSAASVYLVDQIIDGGGA
jgi:hypothetical protein